MVKEIVRDAILIKLKIRQESPLISAPEFCFAAGLAAAYMELSEEQAKELCQLQDFEELKARMRELVKASEVWESIPEGERLKSLILGCRIREEITDEARELFEMGRKYRS